MSINVVLTNSGSIIAAASTDVGGTPTATGIYIGNTGGVGAATDVFTLNNAAGNIIARVSDDLGTTFTWGTAVDVLDAPNATVINLMGDGSTYSGLYPAVSLTDAQFGYVYGNIEIASDDAVTVSDGETWFDGIVNSDAVGDGSVTVASDGLLFMLDDRNNFVTAGDYAGPFEGLCRQLHRRR